MLGNVWLQHIQRERERQTDTQTHTHTYTYTHTHTIYMDGGICAIFGIKFSHQSRT